MKKSNQRKVASVLSVAILLTGTFAWQSFSQMALNESSHYSQFDYQVGGRLHDHYDGTNKDVFVENFADDADDSDVVFARIRLDEYYEYGEGAGSFAADTSAITIVRGDIANVTGDAVPSIGNLDTWDTYKWGSVANTTTMNSGGDDEYTVDNIRTFRTLEFGGSTVYMPTFNKNINSLDSDMNGTYAGPDNDRTTDYDRYADYTVYAVDDTSVATQAEYADPENPDSYLLEPASVHIAKQTLHATVISMEDWMDADKYNSQPGNYWVYDTDGWAYWAQAIDPQTATGLLLDGVVVTEASQDHEEWYYAVNVVSQIATAGKWGDAPAEGATATGIYEDVTTNGLFLLNTVAADFLPEDETTEDETPEDETPEV